MTVSATERVYRAVKSDILSGELPGGQLISEGDVASQVGVSRTPVREAFLRLESEGWLTLFPKRGALVVPVPHDEATHVAHARYVVETGCVRAISDGIRVELSAQLSQSIRLQRELAASDRAAFVDEDTRFHQLFVRAAGNSVLAAFYDTLRERQLRMMASSLRRSSSDISEIIECHADLAEHIAHADSDAFADTLARHLIGVHHIELPGVVIS